VERPGVLRQHCTSQNHLKHYSTPNAQEAILTMKTRRISLVLMMLQLCVINHTIAKECVVAGLSKDRSAPVTLKSHDRSDTTKPNSSGLFRFRIPLDSPQYCDLTIDKTIHLFLIPGDSIFINPDSKAMVSPHNQSAAISDYLIDWYARTDSITANFDVVAFYSQDPASFNAAVVNLSAKLRDPLDNFLAHAPGVNKEFVRLEKARIRFWVLPPYNRYEYRYQLYTGKRAQPPDTFYDYLRTVNFNDPSFLQLSDFHNFASTFLDMKVFKATQQDRHSYEDPYFKTRVLLKAVGETFTNQRVLDEILYKQMWGQIYYMDLNDSLFAVVQNTIKNPQRVKKLQKLYRSLQKFQTGKAAPNFTFTDMSNHPYTLRDFRGKYLLIDVWGVYCSPCIKELPALKEIKAEYRDANITFIQVNLDGTKEAWIKRVKELNLDGLQFMAKDGWQSEFQKAYEIDQVPTFILLDRKGRFIDARTKLPTEGLRYVLNGLPAVWNK
jgi:thiol-disulfide isomerase/thioredoxin